MLVEQFLAFAQTMAQQQKLLYIDDWKNKLDDVLSLNGRELLDNAGKISHKMMLNKTSNVYEKYKTKKRKLQKKESLKELEVDIKALR